MENNTKIQGHESEYDQLKNRVQASLNKTPRRSLEYDDSGKIVGWLERIVVIINTYGMKRIFQALLIVIVCLVIVMGFNALDNQRSMDKFIAAAEVIVDKKIQKETDEHTIGTEIRREITPKINKTLVKMLYELQADRACVIEMHNGKENPTGLPFDFCDMTHEETRGRVPYIADEYEDLNMAKFTFPDYLYDNRVFAGPIDDVYAIDKKLAMRLESNNVKYIGIMLIRTNVEIGFLMVSYVDEPPISREKILSELTYYVQEIGTYLDYGKQVQDGAKSKWTKGIIHYNINNSNVEN